MDQPLQASGVPYLQTFGSPIQFSPSGEILPFRRRKDIALLVYLCVTDKPLHYRRQLANLLWGDASEARALHSLSQSLRRLQELLNCAAFELNAEAVHWHGGIQCDALELERACREGRAWKLRREWRAFLEAFAPGRGAEAFRFWCDERRARYRMMLVKMLDQMGADAESRGRWTAVVDLAKAVIDVEPLFEEGHRRLMRAWSQLGERELALMHYRALARWLEQEVGSEPDPVTQELAEGLRKGRGNPVRPWESSRVRRPREFGSWRWKRGAPTPEARPRQ